MSKRKGPHNLAKDDSGDSSSDDSIGPLEDIMKKGGRKPATIRKEEMYVKKFEDFLRTTINQVSRLKYFIAICIRFE